MKRRKRSKKLSREEEARGIQQNGLKKEGQVGGGRDSQSFQHPTRRKKGKGKRQRNSLLTGKYGLEHRRGAT